jgi:hypothetical protein
MATRTRDCSEGPIERDLAGAGSGFLAERLEAIAGDIERAARAQDPVRVADLLDELERVRVEIANTLPEVEP